MKKSTVHKIPSIIQRSILRSLEWKSETVEDDNFFDRCHWLTEAVIEELEKKHFKEVTPDMLLFLANNIDIQVTFHVPKKYTDKEIAQLKADML